MSIFTLVQFCTASMLKPCPTFSYVDLYAGGVNGVREKIPYFKELGLTYLHLMPLFKCPEKFNDGGYAVSSYREVDSRLGSMDDLRALAKELHEYVGRSTPTRSVPSTRL